MLFKEITILNQNFEIEHDMYVGTKNDQIVYVGKDELPKVLGGLGIAIISTNKGVITDKKARKEQVGGEVLAFVW